jgi:hypothetical protein
MKAKINDNERKVLEKLAEDWHPDEWGAYSFAPLSRITKLEVKQVRRACRSLAKKGFAKYERTLVDMDGVPAGAGYRATEEGAALITPCDLCGSRATFDYHVDKKGEFAWDGRRVRECEVHYGKSGKMEVPTQRTMNI